MTPREMALIPPTVRRSLVASAMLIVLLALANLPVRAQSADGTLSISGRVANGTSDASPPDALPIFALLIDQDAETIIDRSETLTDQTGRFELEVPAATGNQFYRIVADDGIFTPYLDFLPDELPDEVVLTVYERTTSLEDISVGKYAMVIPVIDAQEQEIAVLASLTLTNSGDRVYVADLEDPNLTGLKLLRFNLPEGYRRLSVESDLPSGNVMEIGTGFALSNPVPPGDYNVLMSYSVPYDDGTLEFPLRLPFGATSLSILIPEGSGVISGLGLARDESTVTINETSYYSYEGSSYDRGSQLDVVFDRLPSPSALQITIEFFESSYFRVALIASVAIALVIAAAAVWVIATNQSNRSQANAQPSLEGDDERTEVIRRIARLDALHEDGEIDDDEYETERRDLIRRAVALGEE